MCKGWIKSYRSILDWEWWDDKNTTRLWIYLLHAVNYETKKWHGITIEPGQIITSREELSKATGLSQQEVRTSLTRLKSTSNLTNQSTSQYTLITVVKWQDYQDQLTNQSTNQSTSVQPASNQRPTTTKESKEIKKVRSKEIKSITDEPLKRSQKFIPPSVEQVENYCQERNNHINPNQFVDYYIARDWQLGKVKMKDWEATIRTWERRQKVSEGKCTKSKIDGFRELEISRESKNKEGEVIDLL